jgi:glycosyltransferase involved in cell wall biosynthesis
MTQVVDMDRIPGPMNILVSVCMITYRQEPFIGQAIDGVMAQYLNGAMELVISDDMSPDGTRAICLDHQRRNPDRIRLLLPEKNLGMMPNFQQALSNCRGRYIALCEGDDYWTDPLKLQKQVDFLEANPDHVMCFHRVMVEEGGKLKIDDITEPKFAKLGKRSADVNDLLRLNNFIHTPSVVFRRAALEFPEELLSSPMGDYFLYVILMQHGLAHRLEDFMAVYRKGVGVFSSLGQVEVMRSTLAMNSCILAWLKDPGQRKVLLKRHLDQLSRYHKVVGHAMVDPKVASTYIDFRHALGLLAYKVREKLGFWRTSG